MKVFVCYWDYDSDEGCSSPDAAFATEEEAVAYCRKRDDSGHCTYVELEIRSK